MKTETAYKILDLDINDEKITINQIKRQYHTKALIYHPDKNKTPEAVSKFQDINTAYQHILKVREFSIHTEDNSSYKNIIIIFE
jgi:DnaJ-class molecular chaperone